MFSQLQIMMFISALWMLGAADIDALPLLIPAHVRVSRIACLALFSKILDIAPILQLLALVVRSLDSFEQVVDASLLGVAFGLVVFLVLFAVVFGGFKAVHKCGEELAARVLEYEHGHDGGYLYKLAVYIKDAGVMVYLFRKVM